MITATIIGVSTVGTQIFVQYTLSNNKDGQIQVTLNSAPSDINAQIAAIVDAANYAASLAPLVNTQVLSTLPPPPPTQQVPEYLANALSVGIGKTADTSVNLINGAKTISGFQFTVVLPVGLTLAKATLGASSVASGKTLSQNGNILLVVGLNQAIIPDGEVLILSIAADPTLTAGSYALSFTGGSSTDGLGNSVQATYVGNTIKAG